MSFFRAIFRDAANDILPGRDFVFEAADIEAAALVAKNDLRAGERLVDVVQCGEGNPGHK